MPRGLKPPIGGAGTARLNPCPFKTMLSLPFQNYVSGLLKQLLSRALLQGSG
jgi:hypothetical protein